MTRLNEKKDAKRMEMNWGTSWSEGNEERGKRQTNREEERTKDSGNKIE